MKSLFQRLTIKFKLGLIIIIAILAVISSQTLSLNEFWHNLNENKRSELKHITEVAYSILNKQNNLVKENKISLEQAKNNAKEAISLLRYGNNEYFFLFDNKYNMVMHPINPLLENSSQEQLTDTDGVKFFKIMVDDALKNGDSITDYMWPRASEKEPVRKTSYGKYLADLNLGVATGIYTDDVEALFLNELTSAAISTLILLVLLSFVVFQTATSIINPLKFLEKIISDISHSKNLTIRTTLKGKDELADIGNAINSMLEAFDQTLHAMNLAAEQVSSASIELSATTNQTLTGIENQKTETEQVASAMMQMSTTVHEVASNTGDAANASHEASQATDKGKTVVTLAKSSVKQLTTKLEQAEILTVNLETQTINISSILSVISGIAEQTNLLALNAAIEAARAGEQGRGFAVVADEVRNLSSRTHESTNEINQVITELQAGSLAAVQAIKESKEAADIVESQANETEQALLDITTSVQNIDEMTNQPEFG
ncbi:MAG: methyl-accepting chemotaxis protein, partial [Colwellia sp.]